MSTNAQIVNCARCRQPANNGITIDGEPHCMRCALAAERQRAHNEYLSATSVTALRHEESRHASRTATV